MKKYAPILLLITGLAAAYAATAAGLPSDAELARCFKAHAGMMEKPGLRNWVACWRAHGYLMEQPAPGKLTSNN
ncbi:MAG: hypothetical protein JSR66_33020 [Proteobacteria bacterium]|nr:hypothetical protein [Pseudomonadota bacterium]